MVMGNVKQLKQLILLKILLDHMSVLKDTEDKEFFSLCGIHYWPWSGPSFG